MSRAIAAKKKNPEKDAHRTKIHEEIVSYDLRNPPKNFTPLFGEVVEMKTHREHQEQGSRDEDKN